MFKTTAKPSILLISGAHHIEFHTRPVIPYFEKAGYHIVPQTLYSAGHRDATFEDDVSRAQSAMDSILQSAQNLCVIVHSAGGPPGCEAVNRVLAETEGMHDKQICIIFLASMVNGAPVLEYLHGINAIELNQEHGLVFVKEAETLFYNDMKSEEARPFVDALLGQAPYPLPTLSSKKWTELPLLYIVCEQDRTLLPDFQRSVAREYGMREVSFDCAHCPFISKPEKFVEVVDAALKS